jgi:hypothetical protein
MWTYFRYALVLCLVESSLVSVALLAWLSATTPGGLGSLRLLAVFVGAATVTRLLINVPLNALCMSGFMAHFERANRLAIAGVNTLVYVLLVAPMFLFGDGASRVPLIFVYFGVACLVSPMIPWIEPPRTGKHPSS